MSKILLITPQVQSKKPGAAEKDMFASVPILQSMGNEVTFISLLLPYQSTDILKNIEESYGIKAFTFLEQNSHLGWIIDVFRDFALIDRAAYPFYLLTQDVKFENTINTLRPDVVIAWCSYSWPLYNFFSSKKIRIIFRAHNFEPTFYLEQLSFVQKLLPSTWIRFLGKYMGEKRAVDRSDFVISIPFDEVKLFEKWKKGKVLVLPLTFLCDLIKKPNISRDKKTLDVFYLGASYMIPFHLRGAKLLIEKIAPRVREIKPGRFCFHICGAKLPPRLKSQCNGVDLIYEDYVLDLDLFLSHMDIGAFPVFTGKSMKGKVFESLCRSFPIVITTLGLGGYDMRDGEHVFIRDDVDGFVSAILKLDSQELREELSVGAHEYAERHFSIDHVKKVLDVAINA